jgi:hypothetical protein
VESKRTSGVGPWDLACAFVITLIAPGPCAHLNGLSCGPRQERKTTKGAGHTLPPGGLPRVVGRSRSLPWALAGHGWIPTALAVFSTSHFKDCHHRVYA